MGSGSIPDFAWLAAKSGCKRGASTHVGGCEGSMRWLPLWMHLEDTASVMERLVRCWLPSAFSGASGLSHEKLMQAAVLAGYWHDLGKATSLFQSRIIVYSMPEVRERLSSLGLPLYDPKLFLDAGSTPHAFAGQVILEFLGCPAGMASVVGAHHGVPAEMEYTSEETLECCADNYYGPSDYDHEELWQSIWRDIADAGMRRAGIASMNEIPSLTVEAQLLLSGLVVMADWIASNTHYFPLVGTEGCSGSSIYPDRADHAWEKIGLPSPWTPSLSPVKERINDAFEERFGFPPNPVQEMVGRAAAGASKPGIFILEAPMGIGKTEAALYAAELFAARFGQGGIFFGMPTQATSNGLFPRLKAWGELQSAEVRHGIRLAHGAAELCEDYRLVKSGHAEGIAEGEDAGLFVHEWFEGRKQSLLSEFVLGTIDQLLLAALQRKHFMLRHLGLAGKVVIIDECHAYDSYMNEYLEAALRWLGAYGTPVILLSATLPRERRAALVTAYMQGGGDGEDGWQESLGYPLLTWTDGCSVRQTEAASGQTPRQVQIERVHSDEVLRLVGEAISNGCAMGIVVNTVRRAQEIAGLIRERHPGADVLDCHARFIAADRAKWEGTLLRRFGKKSSPCDRSLVVVGTQVLEQSLDIDFDLIVTEPCPMDLMLQRMGRLHRHRRGERPAPGDRSVCYLWMPDDGASYSKGTAAVYSEWLLMRTLRLLPASITLPDDIPLLVQSVYDAGEPDGADAERKARGAHESLMQEKKRRADAYTLPEPDNSLGEGSTIGSLMASKIDFTEDQALAKVRDSEASVEVLLLVRDGDERLGPFPWRDEYGSMSILRSPSEEECLAILAQRVRLPSEMCTASEREIIGELERWRDRHLREWSDATLIRRELVLAMEPDLTAELCGWRLSYTREDGLQCERKDIV